MDIITIDKNLGTADRLLLQGHYADRNENEDNRRVCSCPQSVTSEALPEHVAAYRLSYRKDHRNGKKKL